MNRKRKSRLKTVSYALATAALMTVVSGCTDQVIEEQRTAHIEAGVIKKLRVGNPSSDLTIIGSDQTDKIKAVAKIKRTDNMPAEEFKMTFKEYAEEGEAEFINSLPSSLGTDLIRQMDITLTVPRHIELDIVDDSGDMSVTGMNSRITIEDQSGDLELKNIEGVVLITDDSGDIKVQNVKGDLELVDDSGDIELTNNQGNVKIEDESGELEISNHNGMISVKDDSGNVRIEQVKGNVIIEDESGDLRIEQIEGDVRVVSDTSGDATIEQVSGTIQNNK